MVVIVVVVVVVVVIVIVVVVVIVSMSEHKVTIDDRAVGVDHLDMVQQPVHRLRLADLGDQLGDGVVLLVHATDVACLLAELHRHPRVLHVELVVADVDRLGLGHGAQCQVGLDRLDRLRAGALVELLRVLAGGREPGAEVDALGLELAGHVLHPVLHLGGDHRLGRIGVDQTGERFGQLGHHGLADLAELGVGEPLADRLGPLGDGVELADVLVDPLVGELGQRQLLHRLDRRP